MILRNTVLAVALIWLALGGWLATIDPGAWPMIVIPATPLVGIIFERFHYSGNASAASPRGDWRATNERFLDDETGRPVLVWFNPTTGARKYVEDQLLLLRMNCNTSC